MVEGGEEGEGGVYDTVWIKRLTLDQSLKGTNSFIDGIEAENDIA